jgi:hypothetical protein
MGLIIAIVTTALTGCGSSTEEEQLTWLTTWNSMNNYDEKIKMLNVCFKEAGVKNMMKSMSKNQQKIVNECELSYITDKADDDGISLDREILAANILQL